MCVCQVPCAPTTRPPRATHTLCRGHNQLMAAPAVVPSVRTSSKHSNVEHGGGAGNLTEPPALGPSGKSCASQARSKIRAAIRAELGRLPPADRHDEAKVTALSKLALNLVMVCAEHEQCAWAPPPLPGGGVGL